MKRYYTELNQVLENPNHDYYGIPETMLKVWVAFENLSCLSMHLTVDAGEEKVYRMLN